MGLSRVPASSYGRGRNRTPISVEVQGLLRAHDYSSMFSLIPGNLMTSFIFRMWLGHSQSRVKYLNNALHYQQAHTLSPQSVKSSFFCSAFLKIRAAKKQARLLLRLYMVWLLLRASDKEDSSRTLSYKTEIYRPATSEFCGISKASVIEARMWSRQLV